jgi:phosphoribosylformylglycinamidine (FGAM) synthase-like enzyme
VTKGELERLFRSAVTAIVNAESKVEAIRLVDGDGVSLTKSELIEFAGMGVAMTANMVTLLSDSWGVTPAEAWKLIVQIGIDHQLPGMSTE